LGIESKGVVRKKRRLESKEPGGEKGRGEG